MYFLNICVIIKLIYYFFKTKVVKQNGYNMVFIEEKIRYIYIDKPPEDLKIFFSKKLIFKSIIDFTGFPECNKELTEKFRFYIYRKYLCKNMLNSHLNSKFAIKFLKYNLPEDIIKFNILHRLVEYDMKYYVELLMEQKLPKINNTIILQLNNVILEFKLNFLNNLHFKYKYYFPDKSNLELNIICFENGLYTFKYNPVITY